MAGPNGAGKSTFFAAQLRSEFSVFVNADEIAAGLREMPEEKRQIVAAENAEARRNRLIDEKTSFAFETVFSRTDYWLSFIRHAKEHSFHVELYFLCTDDPLLNVARVETRVRQGGHSVPIGKIQSRYSGSLRTAVQAVDLVDEFWLYDNSRLNETPSLIAAMASGELVYLSPDRPLWSMPLFEGRKFGPAIDP